MLTGILFGFYLIAVSIGSVIVRRKRSARGDKPNPEDDDIDDDDDNNRDDDDRPSRYVRPSNPISPAASTVTAKPKSTPPPPEGDLSSLD